MPTKSDTRYYRLNDGTYAETWGDTTLEGTPVDKTEYDAHVAGLFGAPDETEPT